MNTVFDQVLFPVLTMLFAYELCRSWLRGEREVALAIWGVAFVGTLFSTLAVYGILPFGGFIGKLALITFTLLTILKVRSHESRREK
jgi:hypothetical protein